MNRFKYASDWLSFPWDKSSESKIPGHHAPTPVDDIESAEHPISTMCQNREMDMSRCMFAVGELFCALTRSRPERNI